MTSSSAGRNSLWAEEGEGVVTEAGVDAEGGWVFMIRRSRSERSKSIGPLKDFVDPVGESGMAHALYDEGLEG